MEKVSSFFYGNVIGLTILVGGVLITLPKKLKETEAIQKQELARKEQAANIPTASSIKSPAAPLHGTATKEPAGNAITLTPCVVASRDIAKGEKISASELKLEKLQPAPNREALTDMDAVVGKTSLTDIQGGSAITTQMLKQ